MTGQQDKGETFIKLKHALQKFQSDRLNSTYTDIKTNPEYARIGAFFFEKLYAPEDFTFRDTSIRKLHKILDGAVYKGMVSAVTMVIELHELSDALDNLMVEKMIENCVDTDMNMDQYQEVYRQLDNYDERIYQIRLVSKVNKAFHHLSKKWIVGVSLKTVRTAAHLLKMTKIMDFIYDGYVSFHAIKNIEYFLETIEQRELAWHDKIWNV